MPDANDVDAPSCLRTHVAAGNASLDFALQFFLTQTSATLHAKAWSIFSVLNGSIIAAQQGCEITSLASISSFLSKNWNKNSFSKDFLDVDGALIVPVPQTDQNSIPLALVLQDASFPDTEDGKLALRSAVALINVTLGASYLHVNRPVQPERQMLERSRQEDNSEKAGSSALALHQMVERLTLAQRLSVELINDILSAEHTKLDQAISRALAQMGEFCGSDRTYLFRETSETLISNTHEWCAPGIEPYADQLQNQPVAIVEPWYKAFAAQGAIYISDVEALPADDEIRAILEMQGIQSLLAVPLRHNGRIFGFVGYDSVREKRSFLDGEISLIETVANIMATMLKQRDVDRKLAEIRAEQDLQNKRLRATLSVIPDILLELDKDMSILSFHSNPSIARQVPLDTLIGKNLLNDFTREISATLQQIQSDMEDQDVVEGYVVDFTTEGITRRYSISVARIVERTFTGELHYIAIVRDVTEAFEQRRNIQRLSRIAQNTTNLVVITDTVGKIEWANPAFEARTGYSLQDVIGQTPGSFLQIPETDTKTVNNIREALRRVQPITCELLNISSLGAKYWVRMTIQPYFDETGVHIGFMSVQTDVTETRKLMQDMRAALSAEHAARVQLRSAVDQIREALIIFDQSQRLVICNAQYRALYPEMAEFLVPGAYRGDLLRKGYQLGLIGMSATDVDAWLRHHEQSFRLAHSQSRMRHLNGRWFRETQQPTPDGGRIWMLSDVTEWKDAEERALADRARAMDASRDGILLVTADGLISYLNPAATAICGNGILMLVFFVFSAM